VPGLSRFRPDLVDERTSEVYEIKPLGSFPLGVAQLNGYLIMLNLSDRSGRYWISGMSFVPNPEINLDDKNTVALVTPPVDGVITYEVINLVEYTAMALAAASTQLASLEMDVGVATLNTTMCPVAQ
jgi:hypothetical protein